MGEPDDTDTPPAVDLGTTAPVGPTPGLDASTTEAAGPAVRRAEATGRETEAFAAAGYTLQGVLGRGGMGVVHKAWDARLQRHVAIKVTHEGVRLGDVQLERFRREAIAAARVEHPGIVAVHGSGELDGRPYLVLELVAGQSLADVLEAGPLAPRELASVVRDVALALHHAHGLGIVHRDVKPQNILLDGPLPGGRPKLADFGLARDPAATERLTSTGDVMGTPAYMAPEQVRGESGAQGPCTDVYGLGGVLYRALTGRVPFQAPSAPAVLKRILHDEPPPPRGLNPAVHVDLETITLRCLQKEPGRRYPTAAALADDLGRYLAGEPILARPISGAERAWMWLRRNARAVAGVALVVVVAAALTAGGMSLARQRALDAEARRRAGVIAAALVRARGELLPNGSAARRDVSEALASDPGPAGVAALGSALDALSERLRGVTRELLLAAGAGAPELVGLGDALDRHLGRAPGATSDATTLALVEAAARRVELRADQESAGPAPRASVLLASAQGRALGTLGEQEARLVCEALGRTGAPDAVAPLGRYLALEESPSRALCAAEALCAIGGPDALRLVLARAREVGPGPFQDRVARLLPGAATGEGFEALLMLGIARLGAADYPAAIAALTSALALDPRSAEALSQRARARHEVGEYRASVADATSALALDPLSLRAHIALASAHVALGEPEAALASAGRAVALAPRSPDALVVRGEVRLVAQDPRGAQADFEAALALDPRSPFAWFGLGAARHQQGDVEGGLSGYDRALQLEPKLWKAWLNRGTLRAGRGEHGAALDDLSRAIDLRPDFAPALSNRGNMRRAMGDARGAIVDLRRALALDPDDALVHVNLGLALHESGEPDAALAALERALALRPGLASAWAARGSVRRARGDVRGAVEDLGRAIELDPRETSAWFNRANARRKLGDLRGAEADYTQALELAPQGFRIWRARALVRDGLGDLKGALADHDRALALEPGWAEELLDRAAVKLRLDDLDGALADLTRSIELDGDKAWSWGARGEVHMRRLELPQAVADFDRAIALSPTKALDAWLHRGECRAQLGDEPGAIADLARFLELAPRGHPARREASEQLEQLRRR